MEAVLERSKPGAERLPRRLLLLLFRQERSVSARMMAAVTVRRDRVRAI